MDGVWWSSYFSFSYLYDHSVGDKEVGGEGLMMIELCVMFNHGLSEDDVTLAVADCMSLYLVRRSNNIVRASMCMQC